MELIYHNYFTRGFWGDEAWTALISQLPLSEILRVTGEDFHPPFYYFLVHFWGGFFSFSETSIRTLSLIFFLLTPVIVFFLTSQLFHRRHQAVFSALTVLFSPILFTYAFESRSYALLAFLSAASALAFWQARTAKGHIWKIIYLIIGTISVYTHYYAWFILASHGFFLLLFDRQRLKRLLLPALGIFVLQLPWLPTLISQTGEVNRDYWIAPINHRTHWEFYLRVLGGDTQTDFQRSATIFISFFILTSLYLTFSRPKSKSSLPIKFILTWVLIPTLIPSLISLKMPVFFYRYLIFSAIPLLLLALDGMFKLPQKTWIIALVLLLIQYTQINFISFQRYPNSFRQEVEKIYQTKTPGDGPIYTILPSFAEVMYYAGSRDQIKVLNQGIVQFSGKSLLDAYVRQGIVEIVDAPHSPYWLLEPGPKSTFINPLNQD